MKMNEARLRVALIYKLTKGEFYVGVYVYNPTIIRMRSVSWCPQIVHNVYFSR